MPLDGLGYLLQVVEIFCFWSVYRWLIPISMVMVGGLGFMGFLPVAACVALIVVGLVWLSFNLFKGFSEGDWGREEA